MEIAKSKILITGGAGSIGSFLASRFTSAGSTVCIVDCNDEKVKQVSAADKNVSGYVCDLTNFEDTTKCIHRIFQDHPDLSIVINNAGLIYSSPLINLLSVADRRHDFAQWHKVIDANLTSVFNVGVNAIDKMIRAKTKGLVINVSSISANGNPGQTAYSAAKAGVNALTATWSKELFMLGIRVAGISPGFFNTDSTKNALSESHIDKITKKTPSQRLGKPDELFNALKFIIENDYFNGKILELDGGLVI